ncbi:phage tail protein, partial [Yersinia enterocolitica]
MAWYRSGTVTSVAGQNVITGTGTQWANNVMGVAPGQAFIVQRANGNTLIYEILAVDSNTRIRINGNVVDALVASNYGIQTSVSNSYSALARETSAQLALYQQLLQDWQLITTGTGNVSIIAPDGSAVVIPSLSDLTAWVNDSKTWFDDNRELIDNAGEAVAGAETARDEAVAAKTAAQSAETAAEGSATSASGSATTAS